MQSYKLFSKLQSKIVRNVDVFCVGDVLEPVAQSHGVCVPAGFGHARRCVEDVKEGGVPCAIELPMTTYTHSKIENPAYLVGVAAVAIGCRGGGNVPVEIALECIAVV